MLTTEQADSWAARAGLHPDIVWDDWREIDDPAVLLDGEDDPPLDQLEPASPEKLAALRTRRLDRAS